MAYKIRTITKNYAGNVGGVNFVDGIGTTDSESLAAWFRNAGYLVKKIDDKQTKKAEEVIQENKEELKETNLKDLTNDELKELLDKRKIEYKSNAVKAELIDLLKEA